MDRKIVIGVLVVVLCLAAYSSLVPQDRHDHVTIIEGITFNTTNEIDLKKDINYSKEHSNDYMNYSLYISDEKTGYYEVLIINISNKTDTVDFDEPLIESIKGDMLKDAPSQTINGVVVYSTYRLYGTCVREPIYSAYVENSHMNKIVFISSSDGNETAKMISTIKFN